MTPTIKQRILQGRLVLFLGAGSSCGCKDAAGKDAAPLGGNLKLELANLAGLEDSEEEDLQDTYTAATRILGNKVQILLERRFSRLVPSQELLALATYPWPRVYTTNIDDAFYTALVSRSQQKITPCSRKSQISPIPENLLSLDLVYLNGYVNWSDDGYLFSSTEYASAQCANLGWFKQLIRDFFDCTFLFIGTKLKESTFYYHLAQHAQTIGAPIGRSFLILPTISSIQKERLGELTAFLKSNCYFVM